MSCGCRRVGVGIIGLVLARAFGWVWMDPLAGIVGALVIASWSWGLIGNTGDILLDMLPAPHARLARLPSLSHLTAKVWSAA